MSDAQNQNAVLTRRVCPMCEGEVWFGPAEVEIIKGEFVISKFSYLECKRCHTLITDTTGGMISERHL